MLFRSLWDAVLAAGQDLGVQAAAAAALMQVRVEAGMIMGDFEYDETSTPFECRMGWAVDLEKADFQGRGALLAHKDDVRTRVVSVTLDCAPDVAEGARLLHDGSEVGFVTMAVPSPALGGATLALARVAAPAARIGTELGLDGEVGRAVVVRTPVHDPERTRVRS